MVEKNTINQIYDCVCECDVRVHLAAQVHRVKLPEQP